MINNNTHDEAVQNVESEKPVKGPMKELLEWAQAIAIAVVLALLIRNFVFTVVAVSGSSMESTLQDRDRMIVWKLGYEPKRGDIVIVKSAQTADAEGKEQHWIKRVIATEGEKVRIDYDENAVYITDKHGKSEKKLEEPYIKKDESGDDMRPIGGISEITVPEDCVFVMGDNRNGSKDSRVVGPFSVDAVQGKAVLRFWPLSQIKTY